MSLMHLSVDKGSGRFGNKRKRGDHPSDSIIKIGQKMRIVGDLRRLAVT